MAATPAANQECVCASEPLLFVISGPSGAGKGTALQHVCKAFPQLQRIVTYTTRQPRPNEVPDEDYRFITEADFAHRQSTGEIYEAVRTYGDYSYGSPRQLISADGPSSIVVELDVKGFLRLRVASQRRVVGIFILPNSIEELSARILERHPEENWQARLKTAADQLQYAVAYDYTLVNEVRDEFLNHLSSIVTAELLRSQGKSLALTHALFPQ